MLHVIIKEEDKEVFARERYEHIHPRVCQRMDAQIGRASCRERV